jgi:arylsulfatase A-like enzyme
LFRKLIDSPWLYFLVGIVLLVLAIATQFRRVELEAPDGAIADFGSLREREDVNLIFILIDTLRSDRLHAWGYERRTSPNIDRLAARGVRFANVEAQSSWTKASMASIWTGMYPERSGVHHFSQAMPDEALLPAEIMQQAGFRTGGIWRNGWVANNFGFDQGFDLYVKPLKTRPNQQIHRNPSAARLQGTDEDATSSAIEFMNGNVNNRFFLYIHYMDVHQYLYADSSPPWGTSFSDIYDQALHWTDRNVGAVVDAVRALGLEGKTMIVIASDHGEAFYEHGIEGHAKNLYREVLDVPLLIVPPFKLKGGLVVEERVANVDIWPTVLDMLGLPELRGAEGLSLLSLIQSYATDDGVRHEMASRPVFSQLNQGWGFGVDKQKPIVSIVKQDKRLIKDRRSSKLQLFDRTLDRAEKNDIALEDPAVAEALSEEIDAFLAIPKTQWDAAPEVKIDEMKRAQLRALGYAIPGTRGPAKPGRPLPKDDPPSPEKPAPDVPAADTPAPGAAE